MSGHKSAPFGQTKVPPSTRSGFASLMRTNFMSVPQSSEAIHSSGVFAKIGVEVPRSAVVEVHPNCNPKKRLTSGISSL